MQFFNYGYSISVNLPKSIKVKNFDIRVAIQSTNITEMGKYARFPMPVDFGSKRSDLPS